ncbi:MAG TPA: lasso peptide biosynthesis B2 protein [Ktedonobacteraceae bacterium]|nr:lasso peptide biosynthesis B2 protein [Ktedonobacteraceae bacterium]
MAVSPNKNICRSKKIRRAPSYKYLLQFFLFTPLLRCISLWPASLERKTWALLALAFISIRLFEWPATVATWHSYWRKHAPARVAGKIRRSAQELDDIVRTIATRHPLRVECKERALSCWWLLSSAGIPATLVLAVQIFPLQCHCWCEAGQLVLSDDRARCEQFTPVLSYR